MAVWCSTDVSIDCVLHPLSELSNPTVLVLPYIAEEEITAFLLSVNTRKFGSKSSHKTDTFPSEPSHSW